MLIVVAIIAILIAISIPMVNQALEKARHSTDAANERAAKAAALLMWTDNPTGFTGGYYWAVEGTISGSAPAKNYGKHSNHTYITVTMNDGEAKVGWAAGTGLCSSVESYSETHTP